MTASGKNAVNKILSNSFLNIQIQQISWNKTNPILRHKRKNMEIK